MDDPQIVLYIAADSPQNDVQYGGTVVAPVVRACYEDILPYLNVKKAEEQIPKKTTWLDPKTVRVNDFVGLSMEEVKQEGLTFEFIGEGDQVVDQMPEANTVLNEGGKVWIYLGKDEFE